MYKMYRNFLMLVCGLAVCAATPARPYVAPEALRSRKFVASALAGGGLCALLALWAQHKAKTAATQEERQEAQRIMKICAFLAAGTASVGAYGAFSESAVAGRPEVERTPLTRDREITVADVNAPGFNVNRQSSDLDGGTVLVSNLHFNRNEDVSCELIKKGASPTEGFPDGENAFHLAAQHHALNVLEVLVDKYPHLIDTQNSNGETPLMIAVRASHARNSLAAVKLLIDAGASMTVGMRDGDTLLHYAARENLEAARYLIEEKGMPRFVTNARGETPLHKLALGWARGAGVDAFMDLLCQGASPEFINACDNEGKTALHYAATCGNLSCMKGLVEKYNADVNIIDQAGFSPLAIALIKKVGRDEYSDVRDRDEPYGSMALYLLNHGAFFDRRYDGNGKSLFYRAIAPYRFLGNSSRTEQVVLKMLELGVDPNDLSAAFTALIQSYDKKSIQLLLGHGCFEQLSPEQRGELFALAMLPPHDTASSHIVALKFEITDLLAQACGAHTAVNQDGRGLLNQLVNLMREVKSGFQQAREQFGRIAYLLIVKGATEAEVLGALRIAINRADRDSIRVMLTSFEGVHGVLPPSLVDACFEYAFGKLEAGARDSVAIIDHYAPIVALFIRDGLPGLSKPINGRLPLVWASTYLCKDLVQELLTHHAPGAEEALKSIQAVLATGNDRRKAAAQEIREMLMRVTQPFYGVEDPASQTLGGAFQNASEQDLAGGDVLRAAVGWSPISLQRIMVAANSATFLQWQASGNYFLAQIMADHYGTPVRESLLADARELSPEEASAALVGIAGRVVRLRAFELDEKNRTRFEKLMSGKAKIKF